ncbi:MAG TPA: adenosylmethionine--8-amino-7-oxononanoate transaminase [Gammaproteobacteria bacterium]|jgi:adenosylmethionine-8-amino-7-oxononanoate aminotransferase|nr:adenosylmethionine--8-amino-7-oxononanoate transaminase [Gammaproteobacteria bacterium]
METKALQSPLWHPLSQMKDYEAFQPLHVVGASGSLLMLADGREIIDVQSSWWCKALGHQHPRLRAALCEQAHQLEHVILANTTNTTIINLSSRLTALTKTLTKVLYASDGSSAVEMAIKLSLHTHVLKGDHKRTLFVALENGYHGETVGAMSVSNLGLYNAPYAPLFFKTFMLSPLPYVDSPADPLWDNCESMWAPIEKQLEAAHESIAAIVLEPILQAAAGMKIYSRDFLRRLSVWAKSRGVHIIADEIMTGIGRTGKMLACEYANIEPDFVCLSKGLTSGWLPLSAVLTTQAIYDLFYDDYEKGRSFLHSHTYAGNPLAARVAVETLKIVEEEKICDRAVSMGSFMYQAMLDIAAQTKKIKNVRGIGGVVAADLICDPDKRMGYAVYRKAVTLGALLRPLGNTIYWAPPLNTSQDVLEKLKEITAQAIDSICVTEPRP